MVSSKGKSSSFASAKSLCPLALRREMIIHQRIQIHSRIYSTRPASVDFSQLDGYIRRERERDWVSLLSMGLGPVFYPILLDKVNKRRMILRGGGGGTIRFKPKKSQLLHKSN